MGIQVQKKADQFLSTYFADVNWGSSTQAQTYKVALSSVHILAKTGEHVKNYWPQVLVLSGRPQTRPALVDLGNLITKAASLMIVGDISQVCLDCVHCRYIFSLKFTIKESV